MCSELERYLNAVAADPALLASEEMVAFLHTTIVLCEPPPPVNRCYHYGVVADDYLCLDRQSEPVAAACTQHFAAAFRTRSFSAS